MKRVWVGLAMAIGLASITAGGIVISQGGDPSATANLWVDTTGGTCTRSSSPAAYSDAAACTFSAANTAAQAGDRVIVKTGSYTGTVSLTTSGSSGNKITWQGEYTSGACPTTTNTDVNAPATRPNPNVTMQGFGVSANYIVIRCFRINTTGDEDNPGVNVPGGQSNIDMIQNYIDGDAVMNIGMEIGTWTDLVKASNITADNNYITETEFGYRWICNTCTITNNEINHLLGTDSPADDNDYSRLFGDTQTHRGNYYHGSLLSELTANDPHTDCFQSWNTGGVGQVATNITIDRNTCMAAHQGILVRDTTSNTPGSYASDYNWTITNNIFVGGVGGYPGFQPWKLEHVGNVIANNNTVNGTSPNTGGPVTYEEGTQGTHTNNIHVNTGFLPMQVITGASLSQNATNLWYESGRTYTCSGSNVCNSDPLFVDASAHNYRTQSGSPARNAGTTVSTPTVDRDNTGRPVNSVYDIGAYESG